MISQITTWLLEAIKTRGILAVILGVIIETIIVPIPSPLILMTAGYILIPHGSIIQILFSALWISVVAGLAQTFGSYMLYFIGYFGGKPIIEKTKKITGVSWSEITNFQKKFSKKEYSTVFWMRALPIMPLSVISGACGIIKMNIPKYTLMTFLGTIPRNFILALLGFFFSGFYLAIANSIDHAETIMTGIIILIIVFYFAAKKTGLIDRMRNKVKKMV